MCQLFNLSALCLDVIYLYFVFTIFLLTEQMWQPSNDVSLKGKMESGNFSAVLKRDAQG